jgi:acetoin utilization protein AcuB
MKPIPAIAKYMSTQVHTIGAEQTLARAHATLRELDVRHLPVLRGGQLVGMLTERDLALVETLKDVDPQLILVEDAMSPEVFSVSPAAKLDEVAAEMAEHKYGSAVVLDHGKVVGIFTTVDVCRALSELLHGRLAR